MSKPERNKKWINIGKNIMAIKEANGMTNEEFSDFLEGRISANKLSKATSGLVQFTDSELFWLSLYTGIDEEDIANQDSKAFIEAHNLYKNSMTFQNKKSIEQMASNNEMSAAFLARLEVFNVSFPIVSDKKALEEKNFKKAMSLIGKIDFFEKEKLDEIICLFKNSAQEKGIEAAYANILSLLGVYYTLQSLGMSKYELLDLLQKKPSSELDITKLIRESSKPDLARKQKEKFFEEYGELFDLCFDELFESKKYKDFADYFWYVKYSYQIINPKEFQLTTEEICLIAEHLLLFLALKGNKYAKKCIEIFDKNL